MTIDLEKLRNLAEYHMPLPVVTAQIAHETYCPRAGGPVTLHDGTCPKCGWRHNPHSYSTVHIDARDLLELVEEVELFRKEPNKGELSRMETVVLAAKLDACGQANLGLRIQCRRAEAQTIRMTEKHDRLHERLMGIERANVDSWENGYAAAQRRIAAWLRDLGGRTHGEDGLPYDAYALFSLRRAAEAIERGDHRKEEP